MSDVVYRGCEDSSKGATAVKRVGRRQTADDRAASSASLTPARASPRLPGRNPARGPRGLLGYPSGDGIANQIVSETSIMLGDKM